MGEPKRITRDNKVELSPAYDLLNTTIVLANPQEESALPIAGKKSNIQLDTLVEYFALERLKLTRKAVDGVLADIKQSRSTWNDLLKRSFLSSEMKSTYREMVDERWGRMDL